MDPWNYSQRHTSLAFLATKTIQNRLITGQNPCPFVFCDVCHILVLRIFPSSRNPPLATWCPGHSRASDFGGSPCQQKGGFGEVSVLGRLHSLPLCLQIIITYRSFPEWSVSLEVTHRPQLLPVCRKLPAPGSPSGLSLPSSHSAHLDAPVAAWAMAPAVAAWDIAEQMALFPSRPVHRSASCPSSGFGSCLDFSAESPGGSKLTQVDKERGLFSALGNDL